MHSHYVWWWIQGLGMKGFKGLVPSGVQGNNPSKEPRR